MAVNVARSYLSTYEAHALEEAIGSGIDEVGGLAA